MWTIEIRAGEGGDDATRFADELTTTISRLAARNGHHLTMSGTGLNTNQAPG